MATWCRLHAQYRLTQFVILWLAIGIVHVFPLEQLFCSSQNTELIYHGVDLWQSNGNCLDLCKSNYAFAIVKHQECWCSNYYPASTVPTDSCDGRCPGYPPERCGSRDKGLFGYIALMKEPSGTLAASGTPNTAIKAAVASEQVTPATSLTSSASPLSTSTSPEPISETLSEPAAETSTPITPAVSSKTSTWSATPFASVITVTGQIKTITVTPTVPPQPAQTPESPAAGKGLAVPKIIGLAVGLASGFSVTVVMALWWYFMRRKRREPKMQTTRAGEDVPQRRPSRLSQMGLVSGTPRSAGEKGISSIQTSGWGPSTNAEKSPSDVNTPLDLRSSYPRIVDQRLDPIALWNPLHDNGSHVSVRSFQDDQDYSRRMLRITNPDGC